MAGERNEWEGEVVRLRAVEPGDWEVFHRHEVDTEAARKAARVELPRSSEAARRWAETEGLPRPDTDDFRFAITNREGELVGTINTHHCDRINGTFEYGIGVFPGHARKGYARDAIRVVLRHYFNELPYQKVVAGVYAYNEASLALHRSLGMVEEGRLRSQHLSGGRHHDVYLFGMTRTEFNHSAQR